MPLESSWIFSAWVLGALRKFTLPPALPWARRTVELETGVSGVPTVSCWSALVFFTYLP